WKFPFAGPDVKLYAQKPSMIEHGVVDGSGKLPVRQHT
ncbi:hypothetical protein Tco_0434662, partial [Tanacetum coccineum]